MTRIPAGVATIDTVNLVAQPVGRIEQADVVAIGLDEQPTTLQPDHDDVVLGIVDLAGHHMRLGRGVAVMAWSIVMTWRPAALVHPALCRPSADISRSSDRG